MKPHDTAGPSEQEVTVDGLRTRCIVSGDGDTTVLFLHGWGGTADSWTPVTALLTRERLRCVAVDLPGSGQAEIPSRPWTLDDFADWVNGLVEGLGVTSVILIGRSFGGRIAARVTARRPDLVERLVLVSSAGLSRPGWRAHMVAKVSRTGRRVMTTAGLERVVDVVSPLYWRLTGAGDYAAAGPRRGTMRLSVGLDQTGDFVAIRRPTLLIWGDRDTQTPLSNGRLMTHLIPGAVLRVIPKAGHHVQLEAPDLVSAEISAFARVPPP